jgi:hypothetical protein
MIWRTVSHLVIQAEWVIWVIAAGKEQQDAQDGATGKPYRATIADSNIASLAFSSWQTAQ